MPLFLDEHEHIPGLTATALADAHAQDVEVGPRYGVTYLRYWFDEEPVRSSASSTPRPRRQPTTCIARLTASSPIGWSGSRRRLMRSLARATA